ncbi:MAG: Protein serine/threonine phosphatase, partial [uncultured bacterium]
MLKNRTIAFRLGAPVLLGSAVIFLVIFGTGYLHSRETILRNVEKDARNLGFRVVYQIESVLAPVEKMAVNLAMQMEEPDITKERLLKMVRRSLLANPEIFGSAVAFEPYGFDPSACFFAPYFTRKDNEAKLSYLGGDDYRYFYYDWYQIPKETGKPSWSEPYFDEGGGNIPMVTFSVPLFHERNRDRRFIGVVTADISLIWLEKILSAMRIYQTGYGFILSPNGTFITHPQKPWIMNETIFSIAEAWEDMELRRIGKRMIQGESGYVRLSERTMGKNGFLFFAPIGYSDWSLGIFFPEAELMAELHGLNRQLLSL